MATDQTWFARLLYPDHFNAAGERIDPTATRIAEPEPTADFDGGTREPEPLATDPYADHNTLLANLLRPPGEG